MYNLAARAAPRSATRTVRWILSRFHPLKEPFKKALANLTEAAYRDRRVN